MKTWLRTQSWCPTCKRGNVPFHDLRLKLEMLLEARPGRWVTAGGVGGHGSLGSYASMSAR